MMYQVLRHGGNSNHKWKVILETESEEEALHKFESERAKMRQGGILIEKNGQTIMKDWAPRLRSRW